MGLVCSRQDAISVSDPRTRVDHDIHEPLRAFITKAVDASDEYGVLYWWDSKTNTLNAKNKTGTSLNDVPCRIDTKRGIIKVNVIGKTQNYKDLEYNVLYGWFKDPEQNRDLLCVENTTLLGEGSFGKVYGIECGGRAYAKKVLKMNGQDPDKTYIIGRNEESVSEDVKLEREGSDLLYKVFHDDPHLCIALDPVERKMLDYDYVTHTKLVKNGRSVASPSSNRENSPYENDIKYIHGIYSHEEFWSNDKHLNTFFEFCSTVYEKCKQKNTFYTDFKLENVMFDIKMENFVLIDMGSVNNSRITPAMQLCDLEDDKFRHKTGLIDCVHLVEKRDWDALMRHGIAMTLLSLIPFVIDDVKAKHRKWSISKAKIIKEKGLQFITSDINEILSFNAAYKKETSIANKFNTLRTYVNEQNGGNNRQDTELNMAKIMERYGLQNRKKGGMRKSDIRLPIIVGATVIAAAAII